MPLFSGKASVVGWFLTVGLLAAGGDIARGDELPEFEFRQSAGKVEIAVAGNPVATYIYDDPQIRRPFLVHVNGPGGVPVTRHHPPRDGQDATDHADMHPGIWLAFGDLNGVDFWRNKGRVKHEKFAMPPRSEPGRGTFAVVNHYVTPEGKAIALETCRFTWLIRPAGYLLLWDSTFSPLADELVFGDQEEMGLGVRVATPLAVANGGEITDSQGRKNEKEVWGQVGRWCDYSGPVDGRHVGVMLMPHPGNLSPSRFHARDYGLLVANPFARKAFIGGQEIQTRIKSGELLRLRFGVLLHASQEPLRDLPAAYQDYLRQSAVVAVDQSEQ